MRFRLCQASNTPLTVAEVSRVKHSHFALAAVGCMVFQAPITAAMPTMSRAS